MISICVPVYNGAKFIENCIKNILNQSFIEFELLISDDASDDNTLEIIDKFKKDNRLKIFKNTVNLGWVKNCNLLISKTSFELYCIIPCDDLIPPDYIEKLYNEIKLDDTITNCYPVLVTIHDNKPKGFGIQKSNLNNNITERIIEFYNNWPAISFRGLVRKSSNKKLLYFNEYLRENMFADTFQILQHSISGKLKLVEIYYLKIYHENNTHSKWTANEDDYLNFYFATYMISNRYFSNNYELIQKIKKKLLIKNIDPFLMDIKIKNTYDYIIMGGGIQGCCCALYLKKLGYNVAIIEKNTKLLHGASANHEGKIHLGFVYSNDTTFGTAEKMLVDALNFSNSIEYLLDRKIDWESIKSKKFLYLVPKTSILSEKELDHFFEKLQTKYEEFINKNNQLNYLGSTPKTIYKKIELPSNFNSEFFDCCYETEEYAINQDLLNSLIIENLTKNNVTIILENKIENIKKHHNYYEIITNTNSYYSENVVNCLWEGKNKIDNSILDNKYYDTNYRYKFGIISESIDELKNQYSITMVNGPFGDYVNFDNYMYFSWYPLSMRGFICSEEPPSNWSTETLINRDEFILSHNTTFKSIFGLEFEFKNPKIIGGIIVAKGQTDINEKDSELHVRNDNRIEKIDNYISISTGKFTSGPYNAMLLKNFL